MRARRSHRLVRLLAVSLALTTGIAVVTSGSPAVAKPSGTPVKLMLISEFSNGVTTPEIANGAKAAVKALNKRTASTAALSS